MADQTEVPLSQLGPFSRIAAFAMDVAQLISPIAWIGRVVPVLKPHGSITAADVADESFVVRRATALEWYILGWVAVEGAVVATLLAGVTWPEWARPVLYLLVGIRIVEILQKAFAVTVFARLSRRTDDSIVSAPRMVFLAFVNFAELAACFGTIYALDLARLQGADGVVAAYYFSLITQLTIGFGDIVPTGYLRLVVVLHGAVAVAFFTLVFARLMTALPELSKSVRKG
jgi:hypothetical protein